MAKSMHKELKKLQASYQYRKQLTLVKQTSPFVVAPVKQLKPTYIKPSDAPGFRSF